MRLVHIVWAFWFAPGFQPVLRKFEGFLTSSRCWDMRKFDIGDHTGCYTQAHLYWDFSRLFEKGFLQFANPQSVSNPSVGNTTPLEQSGFAQGTFFFSDMRKHGYVMTLIEFRVASLSPQIALRIYGYSGMA